MFRSLFSRVFMAAAALAVVAGIISLVLKVPFLGVSLMIGGGIVYLYIGVRHDDQNQGPIYKEWKWQQFQSQFLTGKSSYPGSWDMRDFINRDDRNRRL